MNKPDENTLNRWLNGELEGEELRKMEAWAEVNATDLDAEFKCGIGWEALGADFMQAMPASEEPPYPEFFNHKLQQAIEADADERPALNQAPANHQRVTPGIWQKVRWMLVPTAAAAAIAFYAGSQLTSTAPATTDDSMQTASYQAVYIPDTKVFAAVSESEQATEIVLEGLKPIADELDIVKGETSFGDPPEMMVIQPAEPVKTVTFF